MNKDIARFEKVSFEQFLRDTMESFSRVSLLRRMDLNTIYQQIKLPERATIGSAGYDFFYPFNDTSITCDDDIVIPTGIKCYIKDGWWLGLYPKSSIGIGYKAQLDDTVSVIDGDYYNCESNEGHIFVKITNRDKNHRTLTLKNGKAYCQGIFLPYGIVVGDNVTATRTGGLGSTNK